jgi:hypothetical protein
VDTALSPCRVLRREPNDHRSDLSRGGGTPDVTVWVGPVFGDETAMPRQDRCRLHDEHRPTSTVDHSSERADDRAVRVIEPRVGDSSVQDRELLA